MEYQEALSRFIGLDLAIAEAERSAEEWRWEQARIVWEQFQAGKSYTDFARDAHQARRHITKLGGVWERFGPSAARPEFTSAYAMVDEAADTLEEAVHAKDLRRAREASKDLVPAAKAKLVKEWMADDDGGRTRAEVGRVLHQHDTDVEQHIADVRQARVNEGERPDFEATESVQRVLADYAQLGVDSDRLPATLSDRSKSLIAYAATRALPTVQYHAGLEHEHGFSEEEARNFFGGQS